MVTRKPIPATLPETHEQNERTPQGHETASPAAHSISATAEQTDLESSDALPPDVTSSESFDLIELDEALEHGRRDSDASSHGTWDSDDSRVTLGDLEDEAVEEEVGGNEEVEVPQPLKIWPSQQNIREEAEKATPAVESTTSQETGAHRLDDEDSQKSEVQEDIATAAVPTSLQPGIGHGASEQPHANPSTATADVPAILRPAQQISRDEIVRPQQSSVAESDLPIALRPGFANGAAVAPAFAAPAGPTPPMPASPAPPIPAQSIPTDSRALVEEVQANPWQQESKNPFLRRSPASTEPGRAALSLPPPVPPYHAPITEPVELPADNEYLADRETNSAIASNERETAESLGMPQHFPGLLPPVSAPQAPVAPALPSTNPWSSVSSAREPQTPISPVSAFDETRYQPPPGPPPRLPTGSLIDHEEPRTSTAAPTAISAPAASIPTTAPESPRSRDQRQRTEHYQIKHVNWTDAGKLRRSPILTQNANGPCPLLALVNALVLSTPADMDTALTEALATREQISLGLLLDAVFDELMSGRRGDTAYQLPDVTELYTFLLALHTGMNVNPRFTGNTGQDHVGGFEQTKEMQLYSVFSVPLIHGWLPAVGSPEYDAFSRSAHTFEDAQNIQFLEFELEDKKREEGLEVGEQHTLDDIQHIKNFFTTWPTQLTEVGLQAISNDLKPGQLAILFRNDHFSTLYKEPRHGALMTLVTDAGYGSHEEIVWESLVDVNGAASEMFSGDFRVVSHSEDLRETTPHSPRRSNLRESPVSSPPPLPGPRPGVSGTSSPAAGYGLDADAQRRAHEQEDHDLALALQLQEEEENRQREANERRRREQELSEQFLSNEDQPAPPMPARRRQSSAATPRPGRQPTVVARLTRPAGRPAVSRPADDEDPDAPPSYEQSASDRPYRPAGSTAPGSLQQGDALNAYDALRRQQSSYAAQSNISVNTAGTGHSRRPSGNRLQRRSTGSQPGSPSFGGPRPIHGPPGASNIHDADERCVVM